MIIITFIILIVIGYFLFLFTTKAEKNENIKTKSSQKRGDPQYLEWLTRKEDEYFFSSKWSTNYNIINERAYSYQSCNQSFIINKTRILKAFNIIKRICDFDDIIIFLTFNILFDTDTRKVLQTSLNSIARTVILKDSSSLCGNELDRNICYIKTKKSKIQEIFKILNWETINAINIFNDKNPQIMTYNDICFSCISSDFKLYISNYMCSFCIKENFINKNCYELYVNPDRLVHEIVELFEKK